jgi:hypothetical protein
MEITFSLLSGEAGTATRADNRQSLFDFLRSLVCQHHTSNFLPLFKCLVSRVTGNLKIHMDGYRVNRDLSDRDAIRRCSKGGDKLL